MNSHTQEKIDKRGFTAVGKPFAFKNSTTIVPFPYPSLFCAPDSKKEKKCRSKTQILSLLLPSLVNESPPPFDRKLTCLFCLFRGIHGGLPSRPWSDHLARDSGVKLRYLPSHHLSWGRVGADALTLDIQAWQQTQVHLNLLAGWPSLSPRFSAGFPWVRIEVKWGNSLALPAMWSHPQQIRKLPVCSGSAGYKPAVVTVSWITGSHLFIYIPHNPVLFFFFFFAD